MQSDLGICCLDMAEDHFHRSPNVIKLTFRHVHTAIIQISLSIHPVLSESSLGAFWIAKDAKFVMGTMKTYQTVQTKRLIWVFVGRRCPKIGFHALWLKDFYLLPLCITKTRLFKYIENFTTKNWKFSDKNSDIFHISAQNIDCGYSLELHWWGSSNKPQSMFLSRNKKNNVWTPVLLYKSGV